MKKENQREMIHILKLITFNKNNRKINHFTRFWKNIKNNLKDSIGQNQWDNYIKNKILTILI